MSESLSSRQSAAYTYSLAIDAMSGDRGVESVLIGLEKMSERHPDSKILLIGDEKVLKSGLLRHPRISKMCTVRHAESVIPMDMKPTAALRVSDSSMRIAMQSVASGESAGVVSAGNSGALLALAKIVVRTLPNISRPALVATQPSARGDVVMLDLGANIVCDARNLVEFAIMGEAFAQAVLGLAEPTIGILNVGSEDNKGSESIREAAERLRTSPLSSSFKGFVEGYDIVTGKTDVVVTDGFTGNVALKTGEGALKLAYGLFKSVFKTSILSRLAYLLVRRGLHRMQDWVDPRKYNGGLLVGLNGMVVKSHGSADGEAFAAALDMAMDVVKHDINSHIIDRLSKINFDKKI